MVVTTLTVFETMTGHLVDEVEPASFSWQEQSNTAETIEMEFVERPDQWSNLFTPWKHSIAVEVGGHCLGGPILPSNLTGDKNALRVTARGARRMFEGMSVLPPSVIPGGAGRVVIDLAPDGVPNPAYDTTISGVERGTIAKRLLQQRLAWPGWGQFPIVLPADRPGTRQQTYAAVDRKPIDSAWSDLEEQQGGPDIRLRLRRTSPDSFGWVFETGTEAQPRLQGDVSLTWEPDDLTGLGVERDPSRMGSLAWQDGGRTDDTVIARGLYDPYLVSRGFPLLELDSGGSNTIVNTATADSWNAETLRTARSPWEFWSFTIPTDLSPFPHEYNCGDLATLNLTPHMLHRVGLLSGHDLLSGPGVLSAAGGDFAVPSYLPPRAYQRRIVGLAGGSGSDRITVTCGEIYEEA